jgi:hypothetical protein
MSDSISVDNRDADKKIIRDNLMDELCKRQKDFEKNGGHQRWKFTELWQSGYFEIDANDMIRSYRAWNKVLPRKTISC